MGVTGAGGQHYTLRSVVEPKGGGDQRFAPQPGNASQRSLGGVKGGDQQCLQVPLEPPQQGLVGWQAHARGVLSQTAGG